MLHDKDQSSQEVQNPCTDNGEEHTSSFTLVKNQSAYQEIVK